MKLHRAAVLVLLAVAVPLLAAPRTFVSSTGTDTNPCSRDLPCRTFAAAIAQTNAGGEVVAIDSAGYGPVVVSSAVSIVAPLGVHAGISVSSGDGVHVDAGTSVVVLRNLYINGQGGTYGINLVNAGALDIEWCTVNGFSGSNIFLQPGANADVTIADSVSRHAHSAGIYANSTAALRVHVDRTKLNGNSVGLLIDHAIVSVHDTTAEHNSTGFMAQGNGGLAELSIDDSSASENNFGVEAIDGRAWLRGVTLASDQQGLNASAGFGGAGDVTIDHCSITGAVYGVVSNQGTDVTVANSTISDSGTYGVYANQGVIRLTRNSITRNPTAIFNQGTVTTTGDNQADGNTLNIGGNALTTATKL